MPSRILGISLAAASVLLAGGCSDDGLAPDRFGPTLLQAVAPAGGAASVSVGSTVTVTFSHAMMQGMEMLAALHEGPVTGPVVAGEWRWSADRTRLTFAPALPLKSATRYALHLGGGMRDARGNVIDMQRHGAHMGGQWATGGMMQGGGMMGSSGASHMGMGRKQASGSHGMVFSFTTAAGLSSALVSSAPATATQMEAHHCEDFGGHVSEMARSGHLERGHNPGMHQGYSGCLKQASF
jgi:hypothetical protein